MDKKSIIGFVLISVILIAWLLWMQSKQQSRIPPKVQEQVQEQQQNIISDTQKVKKDTILTEQKTDTVSKHIELIEKYGVVFYKLSSEYSENDSLAGQEKIIMLENKKVKLEFTNHGGMLKKYTMKEFNTWNGEPVQLVDWKASKELSLVFTSKEGKIIDTRNLIFNAEYRPWQTVNLENDSNFKLIYELNISEDTSEKIIITYSFKPDSYEYDVDYELINPGNFIPNQKYEVFWSSSLNLTELRSDEEATFSSAYAYMGGELTEFTAGNFGEKERTEEKLTGNTQYVASRNKYFGVFIIPLDRYADGAILSGFKEHLKDEGLRNHYSISSVMEINDIKNEKSSFRIVITPIDYKILKSYEKELESTMRFSLDFIVRPIALYMIIPFFTFLHSFIPNYGIVIIVFSIVLKILLHPLTKKQMDSMKKMGQMSPKINAIREKYKDDPSKANTQIMKLYKEEGINPAGGCLPLLLQLPILYALFGVFRSTIELRQANFMLWITDLSAPDVILQLPFKIPIFGIDQVAGLATLMGITMFIQQKMTVTDPKQKAMVYLMPIMLTLLFFSFPSGLNLYYFIFNLLSIGQQIYTTKYKKVEPPNPEKQQKPKKKSFIEKMADIAEKQRSEQKKRR
ncbi:MAG: membrane protein insertase YidC [Ignavibacteria bacterium]|nr:membrane protein insertase YidC [Ignavibacteria bacterium]